MENNIFTPFPILTTDNLILRQLSITDDNEIFWFRSDEEANKFIVREKAVSIDDARKFIQKITDGINKNELIYWAITLKNNIKLIGTIIYFNISNENNEAEIGYELLPAFQRKGIMQEAIFKVIEFGIKNMGLRTINAHAHRENESSIKLLEKFNFKKQEPAEINIEEKFIVFKLSNLT